MVIRRGSRDVTYRSLNVTKKSKYHKLNLLKLGWNKNGKLSLVGINLYNTLKESRDLWYYFEFKLKFRACDYVSDVMYFSEELQDWVHKMQNIKSKQKNNDSKFNHNEEFTRTW